jgi:RAB protein geranylgeranyltransferase component A
MMKTLSLREFHEKMTMNTITSSNNQLQLHIITEEKDQKDNDQWYQEKKANNKFRGYNIDIQPKFFYGSSVTCDMLKDADMDKYMDFRVITTILFLHSGKL